MERHPRRRPIAQASKALAHRRWPQGGSAGKCGLPFALQSLAVDEKPACKPACKPSAGRRVVPCAPMLGRSPLPDQPSAFNSLVSSLQRYCRHASQQCRRRRRCRRRLQPPPSRHPSPAPCPLPICSWQAGAWVHDEGGGNSQGGSPPRCARGSRAEPAGRPPPFSVSQGPCMADRSWANRPCNACRSPVA